MNLKALNIDRFKLEELSNDMKTFLRKQRDLKLQITLQSKIVDRNVCLS